MGLFSVLADKKSLQPTLLSLSILNSLAKEPRQTNTVPWKESPPTNYRVTQKDELDEIVNAYDIDDG